VARIPFDPRPPEAPSCLCLSANAGSARGLGVAEFQTIGSWNNRVRWNPSGRPAIATIRAEVLTLCRLHPNY
jgi:glycine hydroxymethyltransferase